MFIELYFLIAFWELHAFRKQNKSLDFSLRANTPSNACILKINLNIKGKLNGSFYFTFKKLFTVRRMDLPLLKAVLSVGNLYCVYLTST